MFEKAAALSHWRSPLEGRSLPTEPFGEWSDGRVFPAGDSSYQEVADASNNIRRAHRIGKCWPGSSFEKGPRGAEKKMLNALEACDAWCPDFTPIRHAVTPPEDGVAIALYIFPGDPNKFAKRRKQAQNYIDTGNNLMAAGMRWLREN